MNRVLSLFAALVPAALVFAPSAQATTIDLTWNACAPLVNTYLPAGEPGIIQLFVNATGQSAAHTGFDFAIRLENMDGAVPDAWRFDPVGCYGSQFLSVQAHTTSPSCPALQGAPATFTAAYDFHDDPAANPPYHVELRVIDRYPSTAPPPGGERRTLTRVRFDHSFSVVGPTNPGYNCGGYEQNMCLFVVPGSAHWFDGAGNIVLFEAGQDQVYFRGDCHPVPADATTWGMIKGQYRR